MLILVEFGAINGSIHRRLPVHIVERADRLFAVRRWKVMQRIFNSTEDNRLSFSHKEEEERKICKYIT